MKTRNMNKNRIYKRLLLLLSLLISLHCYFSQNGRGLKYLAFYVSGQP